MAARRVLAFILAFGPAAAGVFAQTTLREQTDRCIEAQQTVLGKSDSKPEDVDKAMRRLAGAASFAADRGMGDLACEATLIRAAKLASTDPAAAQAAWHEVIREARRAGSAEHELRALDGLIRATAAKPQANAQETAAFKANLESMMDLAAASDRLDLLFMAIDGVQKSPNKVLPPTAAAVAFRVVNQIDAAASYRLRGRDAELHDHVAKAFDQGFPLWASSQALEIGTKDLLERAIMQYRQRSDADGELQARIRLAAALPEGQARAAAKAEAYDLAVRRGRWIEAAGLAPTPQAADEARGRAMMSSSADAADTESAEFRGNADPDAFTAALRESLKSKKEPDRAMAMGLAHADASPASLPIFFEALKHDDAEVRHRAARAIEELAEAGQIGQIIAALDHDDPDVRRWMAITLWRFIGSDPRALEAVKARFEKESDEKVKVMLRSGLVQGGEVDPHLATLQKQVFGIGQKDTELTNLAAGALYRLGFAAPAAQLAAGGAGNTRQMFRTAAEMIAVADRPGAAPMLERIYVTSPQPSINALGYALNRNRSANAPQVLARQRRALGRRIAVEPEWAAWAFLRDARRGRLDHRDAETLNLAAISAEPPACADVAAWVAAEESAGGEKPAFGGPPVSDSDAVPSVRKLARANLDRPRAPKPAAKRTIRLSYREDLNMMVMEGTIDPVAMLQENNVLHVEMNLNASHSAVGVDLFSPLFVELNAKLEAQEFIRELRLEGVPGAAAPLTAKGESASFELGPDLQPGAIENAVLVVKAQIFTSTRELKIPLREILVPGAKNRPDLIVETLSCDEPKPAEQAAIEVHVRNAGHRASPESTALVRLYNVNWNGKSRSLGTIPVPALAPNDTARLELSAAMNPSWFMPASTLGWTPDGGDTAIEAVLDPDGKIDESDESNNDLKLTIAMLLTGAEQQRADEARIYGQLCKYMREAEADGSYGALRGAIDRMLKELSDGEPLPGPLRRAQGVLKALAAQADARDRVRNAIGRLEADATKHLKAEELKKIASDLMKAQIDLATAGFPMSAENIRKIAAQCRDLSTEDEGEAAALGDHAAAFDELARWADRSEAEEEILAGQRPVGARQNVAALFGRGDPASAPAEAFIRQNMEWNRRGVDLASRAAALAQAAIAGKPTAAELGKLAGDMREWVGQPPKPQEELQAIQTAAAASMTSGASGSSGGGSSPAHPTSFAALNNLFGN